MSVICPTILAHTAEEFSEQQDVIASIARQSSLDRHSDKSPRDDGFRVQIDLTDGEFAEPKTINLNQIYWPDNWTVDLHLMFREPTKWTEALVSLNPHLVIVHAEAEGDLPALAEHLHKFGIKVGIALLPGTTVDSVKNFIKFFDHALIFGGHLGMQGGVADLSNLEKVHKVLAINPDIEIGWDGGANVDNIAEIAAAGVDVINVGAAIAKADNPTEAYHGLNMLVIQ
ncbi:ribulose-phosphate 3-epimerase [Alphaproteobacteria bacterium]|nr:ribulose-phosphate 3-epimerase [Alphaproteobacteria bacterium]